MKKTYIVKYDIFPFYTVIEGEKVEFCGKTRIMSVGFGIYSLDNVLGEFGVEMYEELKNEERMLDRKNDEGIVKLQKDLLASSSVSGIMQHIIQD